MSRSPLLFAFAGCAAMSLSAYLLIRTGPDLKPSEHPQGGPTPILGMGETQVPDQSDPARAMALAETDPVRRRQRIQAWADSFEVNDMAKILIRNERLKDPGIREELRDALLASWIRRDMAGLAAWCGRGDEGDGREMTLRMDARASLLDTLGKWPPDRALDWMETSLTARTRDALYEPYFLKLTAVNPAAACVKLGDLAKAESSTNRERWGELFRRTVGQWAAGDVSGAVSWVKALPDGPLKTKALLVVCHRWTETNPQAAAAYATTQNSPQLIQTVVAQWTGQAPEAAAAWAAGLPPGGSRDAVIAQLATIVAQKDPATAVVYLDGISDGLAKDQARVAVANLWTAKDPATAAKWVGKFPEGPAREQALTQLIRTWAPAKPEEAAAWLQTLPDTPSTDLAVSAFSATLLAIYPDMAFSAARSIYNEPMRNAQLEHVAAVWAKTDAPAARQFIVQSSLSDGLKRKLLAIVTPPSS